MNQVSINLAFGCTKTTLPSPKVVGPELQDVNTEIQPKAAQPGEVGKSTN